MDYKPDYDRLREAQALLHDPKGAILGAETAFIYGMCSMVPAGFHWPESRPLERVEHMMAFLRKVRPGLQTMIHHRDDEVYCSVVTLSPPFMSGAAKYDARYPAAAVALALIDFELRKAEEAAA